VNLLALGLADALRDDLFGRLCRDAAQLLGFLRELDLHPDFGFGAIQLLRFTERDLTRAVRHVSHDELHGVQLDQSGVEVESRPQVFVALEDLARRRQVRVLDGADHDGRVDALVLRDDVDHLLQFSGRHDSNLQAQASKCLQTFSLLELHVQPCAPHEIDRHAMRLPSLGDQHVAVLHAGKSAGKVRLAGHRFPRHDLRHPPDKAPIVGFAAQRPIQSRRRHLQGVAALHARQRIFHVEQRAQVLAHALTVFDSDRLFSRQSAVELCGDVTGRLRGESRGPIDDHAQYPAYRLAAELKVEDLESMTGGHTRRRLPESLDRVVSSGGHEGP
jgi:hypothetical protein